MKHCVGLDGSICIVDEASKVSKEAKVGSEPEDDRFVAERTGPATVTWCSLLWRIS